MEMNSVTSFIITIITFIETILLNRIHSAVIVIYLLYEQIDDKR